MDYRMRIQIGFSTALIVLVVVFFIGTYFTRKLPKEAVPEGEHRHIYWNKPYESVGTTQADKDHDPLTQDARLRAIDPEAFDNLEKWRASNFEAHFPPAMWKRMVSLLWKDVDMSHKSHLYWEHRAKELRLEFGCSPDSKEWKDTVCESHEVLVP